MDAKLTLKLDKTIIERAKVYAAEHNSSLSKIIETYFQRLTSDVKDEQLNEIEISKLAKSFTIKEEDAKIDADYKKELQEILSKKYGV